MESVPTPTTEQTTVLPQEPSSFSSFVWKHFTKSNGKGECHICRKMLKINGSTTSNLANHLRLHKINSTSAATDYPTESSGIKKYCSQKYNQETFEILLVQFLVKSDSAFELVRNKEFKNLLMYLNSNVQMPSSATCKRRIVGLYDKQVQIEIKKMKELNTKLSCSLDIWTSPNGVAFLGVHAHYVSSSWTLEKQLLAFSPFPGVHSGVAIFNLFDKVIETYGIKEKVISVTMDNASNNDSFMNILIQKYPTIDAESHIRCFAHVLNISTQELFKEPGEHILNLRSFIRELRLSPTKMGYLREIYEKENISAPKKFKKLILDVPTRWNSTYEMLQRAMQLRTAVISYSGNRISDEAWAHFDWLLEILAPFKEATDLTVVEETSTLSVVVPTYNRLLDKLEKVLGSINKTNSMYLLLRNSLSKLHGYYNASSELATIATVLDPRFNLNEYAKDQGKNSIDAKKVGEFVLEMFSKDYYSNVSSSENVPTQTKKSVLFDDDFLETEPTTARECLEQYFNQPPISRRTSALNWWKQNETKFSQVAKMAKHFLAIPATEASVERNFSSGRHLITFDRSSLLPETIQAIQCLKSWLI